MKNKTAEIGKIILNMDYYYKGSSNIYLRLVEQSNGDIDLITDYGELITSVQTARGLRRVLEDLENGVLA